MIEHAASRRHPPTSTLAPAPLRFPAGSIIQHVVTGDGYVVVHEHPLVAVRTVTPSNPDEWILISSGSSRCAPGQPCESPTCPCCIPLRDAETRRLAQIDRLPDGPSGDPTAPMWPDAPVDVGHLLEPVEPGDALYLSREDVEGVAV